MISDKLKALEEIDNRDMLPDLTRLAPASLCSHPEPTTVLDAYTLSRDVNFRE